MCIPLTHTETQTHRGRRYESRHAPEANSKLPQSSSGSLRRTCTVQHKAQSGLVRLTEPPTLSVYGDIHYLTHLHPNYMFVFFFYCDPWYPLNKYYQYFKGNHNIHSDIQQKKKCMYIFKPINALLCWCCCCGNVPSPQGQVYIEKSTQTHT